MACSIAFSQVKRLNESATETKTRAKNNCRNVRLAVLITFTLLHASSAVAAEPLQFKATQLDDAHEGYFTLNWNTFPSAVEYQLMAADGQSVYRGPLPKAFVSGLANGTYEYHVDALDARGQVLATTATPAVVEVEHWSLRLALALLTCGCAVFLVVVGLIVKGTWQTRSQPPPSSESPSSEHCGDPK